MKHLRTFKIQIRRLRSLLKLLSAQVFISYFNTSFRGRRVMLHGVCGL